MTKALRCPGIYIIINLVSGKNYVGQTNNLWLRSLQHFSSLRRGAHCNRHLQGSFLTHGEDAFVFFIVEFCDINALTEREQFWFDAIPESSRYNLAPVAGTCRGVVHSEQMRLKMSAAKKGCIIPPQTRAAISLASKTRIFSESTRAKISASLRLRVCTDETRAKLSAANTGHVMSDAQKKKLSEGRERKLTVNGRTQGLAAWGVETGLPLTTIAKRLQNGWTHEDAVLRPRRNFPLARNPK